MLRKIKTTGLFCLFTLIQFANSAMALGARPNADPNAPPPPGWVTWFPMIVMVFIFYFLLIRPQSKQRKERKNLLDNLKKGDKVITQGGLHANIVNVGPNFFDVKLNEDTKVKIQKSAVVDVIVDKPEVHTPEVVSPK